MKVISYNLNGIRSAASKGLLEWLQAVQPDIVCFQETKAQPEQLDDSLRQPAEYPYAYFHSAEKKGYSGVAIWSKIEPKHVEYGIGIPEYDREGRVLRADFEGFSVLSIYFPSGTSGDERQGVKEAFLVDIFEHLQALRQRIPNLIICGDYNIAHHAIDIHDPVRNANSTGFLPHERAWMEKLFKSGFTDSFRLHQPNVAHAYSWWSFRANSRANNKGWRIDYISLSDAIAPVCTASAILSDAVHSDHCPISVDMAV